MNTTNSVLLSTLIFTEVLTNLVKLQGEFKKEGGTNYEHYRQQVVTNSFFLRASLCPVCGGIGYITNKITTERSEQPTTNSVLIWIPLASPVALPGVPQRQ